MNNIMMYFYQMYENTHSISGYTKKSVYFSSSENSNEQRYKYVKTKEALARKTLC